jgi:hypothetical protein
VFDFLPVWEGRQNGLYGVRFSFSLRVLPAGYFQVVGAKEDEVPRESADD